MQRQPSINYYRSAPALFLLAFALCLFSACNPGGDLQDDSIDADIRTEIAELNKKVISGLTNNKPDQIMQLCSDEIRNDPAQRKAVKELAAETHVTFQAARYSVRKQFYERRRTKNSTISVSTGGSSEHDYTLNYKSQTRRSFVSIGYVEDSIRTFAVLTVYGNYNGSWKLNILRVGVVKVFGKDAVDWYYRARQQYADNALVDAFNSESMCTSLLQPAGEGWHYRNEGDMSSLIQQIKSTAERDLSFPIIVEDVATKPKIFNASSELFSEGYFPRVSYATKLPFYDSLALARECDSLNAHVGDIFQGLDHYNKTIVYHIYPRVPADDNDTLITYHSMVRKTAASWFY